MAGARGQPFVEMPIASPEALGLLMLKTDLHAARLDDRAQLVAVSDALADGRTTADDLRKRFPASTPRDIAGELCVPVETVDDDPLASSIWRFAEYRTRPARIVIYRRGLAPLDEAVAGALAARLLSSAGVEDVFIAHELYHHIETIRAEVPIARRHQATLLKIGTWRWRTGIAALSEIAAGAFAQALLELPCHPKLLDEVAGFAMSAMISQSDRHASRAARIGVVSLRGRDIESPGLPPGHQATVVE